MGKTKKTRKKIKAQERDYARILLRLGWKESSYGWSPPPSAVPTYTSPEEAFRANVHDVRGALFKRISDELPALGLLIEEYGIESDLRPSKKTSEELLMDAIEELEDIDTL